MARIGRSLLTRVGDAGRYLSCRIDHVSVPVGSTASRSLRKAFDDIQDVSIELARPGAYPPGMKSLVITSTLLALVGVGCGDDDGAGDTVVPMDMGPIDAGPCAAEPMDCTLCGCGAGTFCEDTGECVPLLAAGELCDSDAQCAGGQCGLNEAGTMGCLVDAGETCTEDSCASCDPDPLGSDELLCTASCASDDDCECLVGSNCFECIEGFCRRRCDVGCADGYTCMTEHCIPD